MPTASHTPAVDLCLTWVLALQVHTTASLYERLSSESIIGIEQAARTLGAMAGAGEEGLHCVTREVPGVKQEGISSLVEVLHKCPAVSVQAVMCNTLRIIATDKRCFPPFPPGLIEQDRVPSTMRWTGRHERLLDQLLRSCWSN